VPRAGPLRYWSLTFLGLAVLLASAAALVWGTVNLIGTESCGTQTTQECSSETGLHIVAVVLAPFAMGFGGVLLAFRGGGTMRRWRREKRVADMVARGEMAVPTVTRPSMPAPALPDGPPATWQPAPPAPTPAEQSPVERLQQLDKMKAKGLISAADYESQKKRILGGT
jgi:putative oligomerization/nucleic acid binding protein